MLKRFICLLVAVSMLFAMGGCSGNTKQGTISEHEAPNGSAPAAEGSVVLEMVTGNVGGTWYNTAASLAELINKQDKGVTLQVVPGGGVANPSAIGMGEVEAGWIYPVHGIAATEGTDPYDEEYPGLTAVAGGFSQQYCHFITLKDSGITSVKDALTSGKPIRVLTGISSTVTGWLFNQILDYYGLSSSDIEKSGGTVIYTEYGDWGQLVQDGHVDLMFEHSTLPSSILREVQTVRELEILPMPKEIIDHIKESYDYIDVVIPAETYNGQIEDVASVGTSNLFAINKNVPDSTITALLDIFDEYEQEVRLIHPSWEQWSIENAWENLGAPLHPAAEKWYRDKGYLK